MCFGRRVRGKRLFRQLEHNGCTGFAKATANQIASMSQARAATLNNANEWESAIEQAHRVEGAERTRRGAPVLPPSQRVASLPGWAIAINNKFTSATRSLESKLWTKGYDTVLMLRIDCKAYILHLQWLADHRQSPSSVTILLFALICTPRSIADMTNLFRAVALCTTAATLASAATHYEYKTVDVDYNFDENEESPRSVIMMIPDGTGPNVFTLARTVLDPSLKTRLHIDPHLMGTIQTHSSTSYITDSAAAATAYSTGYKTYDSAIAVDTYEQPLGTVLEAAKARGMVTGMIVTCRVTHATPASFAAHVVDRDSEDDIAAQYVANKNLDFLLGGGMKHFNDSMFEDLKSNGYTVANNYQDLLDYQSANADTGALRLFGLFKDSHMSYEGSRVDHAGHSNDPGTMAKEAIAFDETVAVVVDHVEQTPNTAMLSAADHGTGGLTLGRSGMEYPYPWYPTQLQQQNMSTEAMQERLDEILTNDAGNYTNVTSVTDDDVAKLVTEIATAVDETRDLYFVLIELGHIISAPAWIGWTTVGHVGTDVNLYCKGPMIFERMCKGVHENVYLNKLMTTFLGLEHQQELETMKHLLDPTLETRLHIDPHLMGTVQTHSSTSYITDSASSATAYSTGYKTYDSAIAVDTYEQPLGTVLEAAKARGMVTGYDRHLPSHPATPASFAAHVLDRDSEDDIAAQYVANKNLDFLLGGGKKHFNDSMFEDLKSNGYTVANNYQDLLTISRPTRTRVLFVSLVCSTRTTCCTRLTACVNLLATIPRHVSQSSRDGGHCAESASQEEQAKKHGYFVMIEGSRVDHAGHSNDPGTMAKEAIAFDESVAVVLDHVEQTPNTAMLSAADHGTGGLTLGRGPAFPYAWYPTELQLQNMSTEVMQEQLEVVLEGSDCATGANETCKAALLTSSKHLLANYTNVTTVSDEEVVGLVTEIATAVDETRDLNNVMIELGHVISLRAAIDWTTIGHVGTDVNLYCKGPLIFERMCKGVHENTYLNKLMTTFLGLEHQQVLETLKHRNISVLENPLAF
ncbi:Alkaline phosphatase, active site [Phytophthora cactorum]|nr:Alkaline phosphatase, active site [Phytophthora cactorum]